MPPEQCPRCGRFLKRSFVVALADAAAACPRCGAELTADELAGASGVPEGDAAPAPAGPAVDGEASEPAEQAEPAVDPEVAEEPEPPEPAEPASGAAHSVRPPDLEPETVQDVGDVLHGWDAGTDAHDLARWRDDRRPFPTDTVVVGGAALTSAIAGGLLARRRSASVVAGAGLGLVAGAVLAGAGRRIWRLEG